MSIDARQDNREKLIRRSLRDFEFIARQIINFCSKPISHYKKRPEDMVFTIPSQSGLGQVICGVEAQKKFDRVIDAICAIEPKLNKTIRKVEIESSLKKAYSDYFLKSGEQFSIEVVERLVSEVIATCLKFLVTQLHHFPCVIFSSNGPESFFVGPVVFTRRKLFLKQLREGLKHSVYVGTKDHIAFVEASSAHSSSNKQAHTPAQSEKLVREHLAGAIKYYRRYRWIASVKVSGFDSDLSEERAARIVESAIDIIRVVIGSDQTQHIRIAWNAGVPMQSAHLWTDERSVLHSSFRTSFGEQGPIGWYEFLSGKGADDLHLIGSALHILTVPGSPTHIHQRLIDSIRWYGDATVDSNPAGKVVKYVSAIERLLFGVRHTDRKKVFSKRIRSILALFDCRIEDAEELARTVYDARSGALHGALSPDLQDDRGIVHKTELVARLCILCCSRYYPRLITICEDTPEAFEMAIQKIVNEGLNWLSLDVHEGLG